MGIVESNKETNVSRIECYGSFKIRLTLRSRPRIFCNSTDIVMVLDRSSSMTGKSLVNLKNGAKKFIDIIDKATDEANDGKLGNCSRIAVVSFSGSATVDTQLTTSVEDLKKAVDALSANGSTNHGGAFAQALQLLSTSKAENKAIIMFTDGKMTTGPDPNPIAEAAKTKGIKIYCIGLAGNGGVDEDAVKNWVPAPTPEFVVITPKNEDLENLFEELAFSFIRPGATGIIVNEKVKSCFRITALSTPSKGTAAVTGPDSLKWAIDKLGERLFETAVLEFTVKHIGPCSGPVNVNELITYCDNEHNDVHFPNPKIEIDCGIEYLPEKCPDPIQIDIDGCKDSLIFDAGAIELESLGRILQLDVTLKDICPHKRVALAVLLYELDPRNNEHKRGMKALTIPAHTCPNCRDVTVKCVKFVLPEDLDVSGSKSSICNKRRFVARFIANYIDFDFQCCCIKPSTCEPAAD